MKKLSIQQRAGKLARTAMYILGLQLIGFGSAQAAQNNLSDSNTLAEKPLAATKHIKAGVLDVGYVEAGPVSGNGQCRRHT